MELEELKNTWQGMNKRIKNQEFLTNQILDKMLKEKYHSKINKIGYSEYIGAIICYVGAAYLIMNFTKIEDTILKLFAILVIAFLIVLPVISIRALREMKYINISSKTYIEAIEDFGKRKIKFQRLQKLNLSLALFVITVAIPILSAIQGKNLTQSPHIWTLVFPVSITLFLVFALWVLKSYHKILDDTERMLSDINN